jgi:hypothetical protein
LGQEVIAVKKKKLEDEIWEVYQLSPEAGFGLVVVIIGLCAKGIFCAFWGLFCNKEETEAE